MSQRDVTLDDLAWASPRQAVERLTGEIRYENWFCNVDPMVKLVALGSVGVAAMFIRHWQVGIAVALGCLVLAVAAGKGLGFAKSFGVVFVMFGVFTLIVRQFSVHGETVLMRIGRFAITQEALINGINMASSILGFSAAIILLFLTTQMRDLMRSFERAGLPHSGTYVVLASFETMKELGARMDVIFESQQARGIETDGNVMIRAKAFVPVLGPLVLSAIAGIEDRVVAMDARGFALKGERTSVRQLRRVSMVEIVVAAVFALASIAALVLYFTTGS